MSHSLTLPLVEFGHVQVPAELRGHDGALRAYGVRSIEANDDLAAVNAWLDRCTNKHTRRAYRREAERLLLWAVVQRGKPLSSLMLEDYTAYDKFLADPQPRARWCANPDGLGPPEDRAKRQRPPRGAMEWRPFSEPLKPKSRAYAVSVVKMLTTFLHDTGYLALNPMATFKINRPDRRAATERYLERDLILAGFTAVEAMPRDSEEQERVYERARFLLRLLYGCGARPHEAVLAVMGDLHLREGRWWWFITGKGQKERKVVIPAGLVEALKRYRRFRGLPLLPTGGEAAPLIASVRGERSLGSPEALLKAVRAIFEAAEASLDEEDPRRETLAKASTHWLRHTFATHALDGGAKVKHVQDTLGHASVDTLSIYTHAEDRKQHADLSAQYELLVPQ